eukprot:145994_1
MMELSRGDLASRSFVSAANYIQSRRVSVFYTVLFLLYSYYHSKTRLSQLVFAALIFKSVHESMKTDRYSELKRSIYDVIMLLSQFFGDILTIPYHMMFNQQDTPQIYFQPNPKNKHLIGSIEPVLTSFTPTPFLKNAPVQFTRLMFYEETPIAWFLFNRYNTHIKRECITLKDEGLVALDWWVKPSSIIQNTPQHFNYCSYSNKRNRIEYKSKLYYHYDSALYNRCFSNSLDYPQGDATPILLAFGTFAGDSLSAPTQILCNYFVQRNWRVVVYVRRGCGSLTQGEFLPLTTLKPWCFNGESDYEVVIDKIQKRFPHAAKVLIGLSVGGAYIQSILGNKKYDGIFCGGMKIDTGMDYKIECKDLDQRHPFLGHALGRMFVDAMTKCKQHKLKHDILDSDEYYDEGQWDRIEEELKQGQRHGLLWSIKRFVCPSYGFGDDVDRYLDWAKPGDLEKIKTPFLILDSWGDFMRNREHILEDFSERNKNIIHVINQRGAHCIRREGAIGNKCWISKVAFAFSEYVAAQHDSVQKKSMLLS